MTVPSDLACELLAQSLAAWGVEGHDIHAWPVVTIARGKVMVENGQYFASPGDGKYLKRKIPADILAGTAL